MTSRVDSEPHLSTGNLVALLGGLIACMLACLFAVAGEKSGEASAVGVVLEILASDFGAWGVSSLAAIAAVLWLARTRPAGLPGVVVVSAVLFLGLRAVLHVLNPDVDPVKTPMSLYVHASHGYLMAPSFLAATVMFLAGGVCLLIASGARFLKLLTALTVGVLIGASVIAGVFPADPGQSMEKEPAALSTNGMLHQVAGRAFPLMVVFAFLILPQIWKQIEGARAWIMRLVLTFPLTIAAAIRFQESAGLAQRVLLVAFATCLVVACLSVRSTLRAAPRT